MFSNLLRRHLTYANVVATLALVFAMAGSAYAARHYLITSPKQISPKVLKTLRGNVGAPGPQGAAGAQGSVGPAGASGKGEKGERGERGEKGETGEKGSSGAAGKGVIIGTAGGECPEGGTSFEPEGGGTKHTACNGAEGPAGKEGKSVKVNAATVGECPEGGTSFEPEGGGTKHTACNGSPWTDGGTLPSKKTETGVWGTVGVAGKFLGAVQAVVAPISFTIPLSAGLAASKVHIIARGQQGAGSGCPMGSSAAKPEAEPGNLCVFVSFDENVEEIGDFSMEVAGNGTGRTGTLLAITPLESTESDSVDAQGTWAVAAE